MPARKKQQNTSGQTTDKDLDSSHLYEKIDKQLGEILEYLKLLGVSDKRADPDWQPDPDFPNEPPPLIDTDPPTDIVALCKVSSNALKPKARSEAKQYTGLHVRETSVDDVFAILTQLRKSIEVRYVQLTEARSRLTQQKSDIDKARKEYTSRNSEKVRLKVQRDLARARKLQQAAQKAQEDLAAS
jgi:hypothetical protein